MKLDFGLLMQRFARASKHTPMRLVQLFDALGICTELVAFSDSSRLHLGKVVSELARCALACLLRDWFIADLWRPLVVYITSEYDTLIVKTLFSVIADGKFSTG